MAQEQLGERIRITAGVPAEQLRVRRLVVRGRARLRQRAPGVAARLVVFRGRPPVVPRRQDSAWRVQLDPFTTTLKISAWNLLGLCPVMGGSLVNQIRTYRPLALLLTVNVTAPATSVF